MSILKLHKHAVAIAAGIALAVGAAPVMAANDAPDFTLHPGPALTTSTNSFDANQILGSSSELLHTVGNSHNAAGWLQMTGMTDHGTTLGAGVTRLTVDYGLYVTFTLSDVLTTGTSNTANSTNTLQTLNFKFWADPGFDDSFVQANASKSTEASVVDVSNNDILLGVGTLVSGTSGFDNEGGAFLNSNELFGVCSGAGTATIGGVAATGALASQAAACQSNYGTSFFAAPVPFYTMAFDALNNTTQGLNFNPVTGTISINNAAGTIDFNNVPEPGTLALLGLGLLGVGATTRRSKF